MMTVTDINGIHYTKALRAQADKLSTYSIAIRQSSCSPSSLSDIAALITIDPEQEAIAARLNKFENVCHVLSHLPPDSLRQSELDSFAQYARIAVKLDQLMLTFAATLAYEEERQNSRNWIEDHQWRPDHSGELPEVLHMIEKALEGDTEEQNRAAG